MSDIGFQDFMSLYKKFAAKPYLFLVIDTTLASDNPLHFKNNISERIEKLIITSEDKIKMKNYNMILIEKQQKYQHYLQVPLLNMDALQAKKYYVLMEVE